MNLNHWIFFVAIGCIFYAIVNCAAADFNAFAESSPNDSTIFDKNEFLLIAGNLLPEEPFDEKTWDIWMNSIKDNTNKHGKELFKPIRIALTGKEKGPELKYLMPLLTKEHIQKKLGYIK